MLKQFAAKAILVLAGLGLAAALKLNAAPAEARVFVSVGVPFYGYGCCGPYYGGYPYGYYPPPVVYAPPPVVYQPPVYAPPPPQQPVAQQAQTWYYCDNPKGYYPYVQQCSSGWRQTPAAPPR
jgi:hypothetical protein